MFDPNLISTLIYKIKILPLHKGMEIFESAANAIKNDWGDAKDLLTHVYSLGLEEKYRTPDDEVNLVLSLFLIDKLSSDKSPEKIELYRILSKLRSHDNLLIRRCCYTINSL